MITSSLYVFYYVGLECGRSKLWFDKHMIQQPTRVVLNSITYMDPCPVDDHVDDMAPL